MTKISLKILFVIFCVFSIALSRKQSCQNNRGRNQNNEKRPKDLFSVLALSWLPQFCYDKHCFKNPDQNWNHQSLTIHGYWPGGIQFTDCWGSRTNYPCFDDIWNSLSKEDQSALQIRLRMLWPITTNTPLWQHQWNKHGSCYAYYNFGYKTYDDSMSEKLTVMFKTYFMSTIQKYNDVTANMQIDTSLSFANKTQLASALGIDHIQDSFYALCSGNFISQIRFCYDLGNEGSEKLTKCPVNPDKNLCRQNGKTKWRFTPVSAKDMQL